MENQIAVQQHSQGTMQGFMECFGADCLDMMRELAAQGDTDAHELLEKVEGQTQVVAA